MKDFWIDTEKKVLNKKKIIIATIIAFLVIIAIVVMAIYSNNREARNWIDKNILKKEVKQNNLQTIEIETKNDSVCAFYKYIGILNKNQFDIYSSTGKKEKTLNLEITTPIFSSNGRYLAVAEKRGKKLYIISDKDILWEKEIEGNIDQVTINENGFIAVTIVDTSYKTVVAMYNNQGDLKFKTFSSTRVVSTSISNDNKYLALAEVDTSGTLIQSDIKIISIADVQTDSENSFKNIINGDNDELIINIKYQGKNRLICMYANKITCIKENGDVETLKEYDKNTAFSTIELENSMVTIQEQSSGLFTADSIVNIKNTDSKNESSYVVESIIKEIYSAKNVIALNVGTEVEFVGTNGWLIKKYSAEQEITSIVLTESLAGIVYRDRIEIVNL